MSLSGMMRTGVSGMNAQANRLSTVAENIANSDTVGYKKASVEFSSLTLPTTNGSYNSGSVESAIRYSIDYQGPIQATSSPTDLAIEGGGFFVVDAGGAPNVVEPLVYTRAGSFTIDNNGYLVNAAGYRLIGREGGEQVPIRLEPEPEVQQTENVRFSAVLPLEGGVVPPATMTVYDSQGVPRELTMTFSPGPGDPPTSWNVEIAGVGTTVNAVLEFSPVDGSLTSAGLFTIDDDPDFDQPVTVDLSGIQQLEGAYEPVTTSVDGSGRSAVEGLEIAEDGTVYKIMSSGIIATGYQIELAAFPAPNGLEPRSGNVYAESAGSGVAELNVPGEGGRGQIISGALESSNVDIAEELTSMIESQRYYTANSKAFQTGSELLDILVNLKR